MDERCAGKMVCKQPEIYITHCRELVDIFKEKSRFVLGISQHQNELTHMQLMKIRCGGLLGMHRLLTNNQDNIPNVLQTMKLAEQAYGDIKNFPFSEIVKDINDFKMSDFKLEDYVCDDAIAGEMAV